MRNEGCAFLTKPPWVTAGLALLLMLELICAPLAHALSPGDIVVVDGAAGTNGHGALFRVDPTTGARTLLNDFGVGPNQGSYPVDVTVEASGQILVVDKDAGTNNQGALFRVDPVIGVRTLVSDFGVGSNQGREPNGVAVAFGEILVIDVYPVPFAANGVLFRVDPTTGARTILSNFNNNTQGGTGSSPVGVAVDASGQILVVDQIAGWLFRVDPLTGVRTVFSDFSSGSNPGVRPFDVAVEGSGQILVVDYSAGTNGQGALFRVDPITGARTLLSDFGVGPNQGVDPAGVAVVPQPAAACTPRAFLVIDPSAGTNAQGALFRIDATTGARALLSDFNSPDSHAADPGDVAVEASGQILVVDPSGGTRGTHSGGALFRVDPTTGGRTLLSDFGVGSNQGFTPQGVAVEASGQILVIDSNAGTNQQGALFRVDPTTGARTLLNDFGVGSSQGLQPAGVAVEASGQILVVDVDAGMDTRGALFRVDPATGARTLLSDFGVGSNQGVDPSGVAVEASGQILVVDQNAGTGGRGALFRVDPATGDRTLLSDFGSGSSLGLNPIGVAVEDSGWILVTDQGGSSGTGARGALFRVHPATGTRTLVNDFAVGPAPGVDPFRVAVVPGDCPQVTVCGDGLITGGEECDDGNASNGDGCSATCTVEPGFQCSGQPSVCEIPLNPTIKLSPAALDFGTGTVGTSLEIDARIENLGATELTVTAITRCTATSSEFAWSPITLPFTIAAFSSLTLAVTYSPGNLGTDNGCLQIGSSDPTTPFAYLSLTGAAQAGVGVVPATLPDGTVAVAYGKTITASGGQPPYSFAVTGGVPPNGLALSDGGALTGTPTAAGTYHFTVAATDSTSVGSGGPLIGSRSYALTVNRFPATVVASSNANPSVLAQSVTLTATVTGAMPTGTVTLREGAVALCIAVPLAGNQAQCATAGLAIGSHSITATYSGNADNTGATSPVLTQVVNKVDTTTTIGAHTPDPSTLCTPIAISASVAVTAPGTGTPSGTITVSDGTAHCAITLPATSCNLTPTGAGTKALTATYAGDTKFAGSVSSGVAHTVDPGPGGTPTLQSAVSRKVHGAAGTFDLALLMVPNTTTIEPRQGPAATIVMNFDKPVTGALAAVTEGVATAGAPTLSCYDLIVELTDVSDMQYVTIALSDVISGNAGTGGSGSVRIGFLAGDVNGSRGVTGSDVSIVKSKSGQTTSATNFRMDLNASGGVTGSDISIVKSRSGQSLN